MYATIRDKSTGDKTKILTEPLTNYNILVLDQALRGRSYITFTNTNVIREGQARDANVTGLDFSFYDKKNIFNIRGYGHYSKIFSTNSTEGYNTQLRLGKVSGRWQYYAQNLIRSLNYNPTDLGYLQTANQHINQASIGYYQYEPTRSFLNYNYTLTAVYRRLYRPDVFNDLTVEATSFWYLRNFWDISLRVGYLPDQHDYFVIGRPFDQYARRPQYGYAGLSGSTDSRKRLYFQYDVLAADFFKNPEKEYYILSGGVRYRFSNKLTIDLNHRFETETDYIVSGGRDGMGQPRMAFVDFKDVTSILSGIYNFTPRINLTLRVRHYWSNVKYKRIAYIDAKGYPQSPAALSGLDNVNFFNTDAFLTWDFRYGSRLILGYKSWLGDDQTYSIDGNAYKRYLSNFGKTFDLSHGTELTVRFIYFLDYNQLKRSK